AWVKASNTVSATGNGVKVPLSSGPSRSASSVTVSTSAIAETMRSGRSSAQCAGAGAAAREASASGRSDGSSHGTAAKLASDTTSAATGPGCHAYTTSVSAVNADQLASR